MSDNRPFLLRHFTKSRFAMVIGISLIIHFLVGVFFGGKVIFDTLIAPEPQLEAPAIPESIDPVKREYKVKMKKSQQQSAAPLPIPIVADLPTDVSLDNIDLNLSNPRSDTRIRGAGEGDGIGNGFGDGFGDGNGFDLDIRIDQIEFFGAKGGGSNVVFVIDVSKSLAVKGDRSKEKIMRAESTRVIENLPPGINFAVIFFAGPAWSAFDDADDDASDWVRSGKGGDSFRPKDWGDLPAVRYYGSDTGAVGRATRSIRDTPLVFGTIFDAPIYMALTMEPTPDTIFFMTDGNCSEDRGIKPIRKMIQQMKALGKPIPVIHTVGLGTGRNRQLDQIAELTGGTSSFLTTGDYTKKYGEISFRLPDDDGVNTRKIIEEVGKNKYPINFQIK